MSKLSFAREQLKQQVKAGILSEVSERSIVINPISCVFTNKWRLVVDCRLLNPYNIKRKIKLEDLSVISKIVSRHDYISTDNFEKGYWQVKLNSSHKKYIRVSLDNKYYVANVLILGICDSVFFLH